MAFSLGFGSKDSSSKSRSESKLPEWAESAFKDDFFPAVQSFFQQSDVGDIYQGTSLGELDPLVTQGQEGLLSAIPGYENQLNNLFSSFSPLLSTDINDPNMQAMINSLGTAVGDQFNNNILPGIGDGAQAAGQFSSSRHGVAEGLAAGEASKALTSGIGQLINQQRDRALQASAFAPQIYQQAFSPYDIMQGVGESRTNRSQLELLDEIQQFNAPRDAQYEHLVDFQALINNNPLLSGVGTKTSSGSSSQKSVNVGYESA